MVARVPREEIRAEAPDSSRPIQDSVGASEEWMGRVGLYGRPWVGHGGR